MAIKIFTDFSVCLSVTNMFAIMQGRNGRNEEERKVEGAEKVGRYLEDLPGDACGT